MSNDYGWRGKTVRHLDGRTGTIDMERTGFLHIALTIAVDAGEPAHVQLNANGQDSGDTGWAWLCPEFSGGPAWLPLGDHNKFGVQHDEGATA